MSLFEQMTKAPPRHFADALASDEPVDGFDRRSAQILAGLFLLCLVPRLLTAWRIGAVSIDAYYYFGVADALEKGEYLSAFSYLNLNIYPLILSVLHRMGLDWLMAGKLWGALISSLVVLPMYGWVRRLFDVRVAVAACFLYAVHSELIEYSVEPLREPTFWFFFTLCFYLTLRAVTETKWWLFVLSGMVMGLAVLTRSEGWILIVPMIVWMCFRWKAHRKVNAKLIFGTFVCLAMIPCLLVLVNLVFLQSHAQWEWGRVGQLKTFYEWVASDAFNASDEQNKSTDSVAEVASISAEQPQGVSLQSNSAHEKSTFQRWLWFMRVLVDKLEPVNLVFMLIGLIGWRHLLVQRDKILLVPICLVLCLSVWIYFSHTGAMNGRYFFTILLVAIPFEALGFLLILHRLSRVRVRWEAVNFQRATPAVVFALLLTAAFWTDTLTSRHKGRQSQVDLGNWLKSEYGPFDSFIIDQGSARVVYHATGRISYEPIIQKVPIEKRIGDEKPALVVLSISETSSPQRNAAAASATRAGMKQIDLGQSPIGGREFVAFVRKRLH